MEVHYLLQLLRQKLWLVILLPVITTSLVVVYLVKSDNVYKSTAQISSGITVEDERLGDEINPWEASNKFNNLIETMNSPQVISLVSYKLLLHELSEDIPFRNADNEELQELLNELKKDEVIDLVEQKLANYESLNLYDSKEKLISEVLSGYKYDLESLQEDLRIRRMGSSDYIRVEFFSENPFLSAFVVNEVCDTFIEYNLSLEENRSGQSLDYFKNLVTEKNAVLKEKTKLLNSFKVSNNVINYSAETESKIAQIAQYDVNRENEEKLLKSLRLELVDVNSKLGNLDSDGGDNVAETNSKILKLRRKISELNGIYKSGGSQDQELAETIEDLRDQLQVEMASLSKANNDESSSREELLSSKERLELNIRIASSNLESINSKLVELRSNVSQFAAKEARISALEREVEVASQEYLDAQEKYNVAKSKSLITGGTIQKVLAGQPSDEPEPSKALIILGLSVASGLFCAVFFIVGMDYLDATIRIPQRLERFTNIKPIGSLNSLKFDAKNLSGLFTAKNISKDKEILKQYLRKIRVEIQKSKGQTFLVTSTRESAGKTFFISCISYVLSLVGKRVLIIDTNFKNNALTKFLLPKNSRLMLKKGAKADFLLLEEDLSNSRTEEERDNSIVSNTSWRDVFIIGNRGGTDSPSEILSGRDFHQVMHTLSQQYDYIFLEGAALNEYSDTRELVDYVDKVIVVFSANSMVKGLDQESIEFLHSLKDKLLGAILNKVQLKDLAA